MAAKKSVIVKLENVSYNQEEDLYYLNIPGYRKKKLYVNKSTSLNVVWDQAFRSLYFGFRFDVIYSQFFYCPIENKRIDRGNNYKIKGFFRRNRD